MKKLLVFALAASTVFGLLLGCAGMGRGHGPVDAFQFSASKNPSLDANATGAISEGPDPAEIVVVVPPGTDVRNLVATLSLNTEGVVISVVSSGDKVLQQNGVTPNDFSTPVLYSIEVPKDKNPWRYRVTVREAETDASLAQLAVPEGAGLQPSFSPRTKSYAVVVPFAATKVRIDARGSSPNLRSISVDGIESKGSSLSTNVDFSSGTQRDVRIETLAEDGVTQAAYTLLLKRAEPERNALLSNIEVTDTAIAPAFAPQRNSYQAVVPFEAKQFALRATPQGKFAKVTLSQMVNRARMELRYRGDPADRSGATVDFAAGERLSVIVTVTAQDGGFQDYTVDVVRAEPDHNNQLAELAIAGGTWSSPFSLRILAYVVEVPFATKALTITARPQSKVATMALEPGPLMGSADASNFVVKGDLTAKTGALVDYAGRDRISLAVAVRAQDGKIQRYVLDVRRGAPDRNADLGNLTVSAGVLSPLFSAKVVSYVISLPAANENVKITATAASPVASVGVTEQPDVKPGASITFPVAVAAGKVAEVNLVVTAEEGTQRLYRIRVSREAQLPGTGKDDNARLASLQVTGRQLSPAFDPGVLAYDVRLPADADTAVVVAVAESTVATVQLDGQALARAGRTVVVESGSIRAFAIDVTAENGTVQRYALRISRDAAPGPKPPSGSDRVAVLAKNLRLEKREADAMAAQGDKIGATVRITVRYYRTNEVVLQENAPVDAKATGSTQMLQLDWQYPGIGLDHRRLVEVEVAIPTGKGFLYYTEAQLADAVVSVEVPFLLYGANPRVSWPVLGRLTKVIGYMSILPSGKEREADKEDFEKNAKGEYGVTVEFFDAAGKLLAKETVWTKPGLPRGYLLAFAKPVELPEGATVKYVMTAKSKNGKVWQATGTAQIWTTRPAYAAGFEPVSLELADELSTDTK